MKLDITQEQKVALLGVVDAVKAFIAVTPVSDEPISEEPKTAVVAETPVETAAEEPKPKPKLKSKATRKSRAKTEKVEEPKVEEPKVEEPKVEEPKVEEPKVEEPKVEEPKVEETKVKPEPDYTFVTDWFNYIQVQDPRTPLIAEVYAILEIPAGATPSLTDFTVEQWQNAIHAVTKKPKDVQLDVAWVPGEQAQSTEFKLGITSHKQVS